MRCISINGQWGLTLMRTNFKNWSLVILVVTAFTCSRTWFAFIDDPEGPNLLVVTVMAALLFAPSAAAYLSKFQPLLAGFKRTAVAVFIQIVIATCLYLALR
jgi:hypothetical protein